MHAYREKCYQQGRPGESGIASCIPEGRLWLGWKGALNKRAGGDNIPALFMVLRDNRCLIWAQETLLRRAWLGLAWRGGAGRSAACRELQLALGRLV